MGRGRCATSYGLEGLLIPPETQSCQSGVASPYPRKLRCEGRSPPPIPSVVIPFPERRRDWGFVAFFAFAAYSSAFVDPIVALGVPITRESPNPLVRALVWYAHEVDPIFLASELPIRLQTAISAFVFGPFYLVLIAAFVRGWNGIRTPALLYVGAMTYGMVFNFGLEFLGETPPANAPVFLALNLPYLIVPSLLGWRMRRERPFDAS